MPSRDANGKWVYSQAEYEHHIMMEIPFTGFVDGVGYVLSEVVVTPHSFNRSGTHFMFDICQIQCIFDINEKKNKIYVSNGTSLDLQGAEHLIGPSLILLGQPIKYLKPIGALGSKPGSSIASYTLSKIFPARFTSIFGKQIGSQIVKKVGTNVVGRAAGRAIPYVGWYMTAWDIGRELGERYGGDAWVRWYKKYREQQKEKEFQQNMELYLKEFDKKMIDNETIDK